MNVISCDHPRQDIKISVNNASTVYLVHSCLDLEVTIGSESGAGEAKIAALSAKSLTVFQTGTMNKLEIFCKPEDEEFVLNKYIEVWGHLPYIKKDELIQILSDLPSSDEPGISHQHYARTSVT